MTLSFASAVVQYIFSRMGFIFVTAKLPLS